MHRGYLRYPHIQQNRIVFVSEDDLWFVSSEGGRAEHFAVGVSRISHPRFSPDGQSLAFVGREEGPSEVYVMPTSGGPARRLTFQASSCYVLGWSLTGREILYTSNAGQHAERFQVIYTIDAEGGQPRRLPLGVASTISYGPGGAIVLGRNVWEPAYRKGYRGGAVGQLWCDAFGDGNFRPLLQLPGNIAAPCWVGQRIYFLSDYKGMGNIYSCTPLGEDVRCHTDQQDFYARHLSSDGQRLVYCAGGDLYLFDPYTERVNHVDVALPSLHTQLNRKFVSAGQYLDSYALHPQGKAVAVTTRGKAFSMGNWDGPVLQYGEQDGARYRLVKWLNDGKRLVAVSNAMGWEALVLFNAEDASELKTLASIEFGRALSMVVSPSHDVVAIGNHRHELIVVDLEVGTSRVVDRSDYEPITDVAWSPDGNWLAYSFAVSDHRSAIKLYPMGGDKAYFATEPVLKDVAPSFDPGGSYLYFLGYRTFQPVRDNLQFELSFPRGVKPYSIPLRQGLSSPFRAHPKEGGEAQEQEKGEHGAERFPNEGEQEIGGKESGQGEAPEQSPLVIDLEGITSRAVPFPLEEGRFADIQAIKDKVLVLERPDEATIHPQGDGDEQRPNGKLYSFDLETRKYEWLTDDVSAFDVSRDHTTLVYRSGHRLRVLKAGEKPPKHGSQEPGRESGWLALQRIKVSVRPRAEWKQMFTEAWRLQKEHFWTEDMSGVDWHAIYDRYAPLVERVSSRAELSDVIWEMQGELGTSHAYEMGGEYRQGPNYRQGFLGIDWMYDSATTRYRIAHIVLGDTWSDSATSPLTSPDSNAAIGDAIVAINGQKVGSNHPPQELLVNQAGEEVQLIIEDAQSKERRVVTVKALADERPARYREWVEKNRQTVHTLSEGQVGYIHIPDMRADGYGEFHRAYLSEYDYPALLIDVRWNAGGSVSGLLLEKLGRRRLGYDFSRWGKPIPYPAESPRGPMVALINEHTGSDGDVFSHAFKLMGLGPLIGKRTWGGVIGYRHTLRLVDGTQTTQPEYAFWFKDVGWSIENYGAAPDIEVDIAPQDYAKNVDPQLERAITEALRLLGERPFLEPTPGERPRRCRSG